MAVFFVGLAGVVFLALLYTLVTRAALLRSRRRCEAMRSQRDLLKGALSQIEKERDGLLEALQTERDRVEASFVSQNDRLRSTVDGFIRAASRIRSQLFPAAPPGLGKIIQSVRTTYHISRNFDAEVHRHYVIRAGERPLHFWQSSIDASGDAQPAEAFTDISFRLICRTPGKDVVYLPTKDERFAKAACIYFLPLIGKGEIRDIEIVYRWPGLMLQLAKTGWEDFTFDLNSAAPIDHFELEVFLEPGSGGQLSCSETGVQLPNASITQVKNDRGWVGWSYKASAIDTALLEHEIKARLEWRRS
jgi:hypothetical protein